ncbi:hypothetical protein SBA1_660002 [Candidatus Sulfotelmatobacter kueseliae]|uniref:Uncharacterized protein n=1 Tax=Candidatus Sulfotelmatobacter kueseliae TaxID=2042962 RepID=A0A2U3L408_9BACT|nr:hypothetical protein SBA1_660002 [Candidatus Sulfotelmatobacter kueseliae]
MKNAKSRGPQRTELGRHIVADPAICHGQPTFKGTRIMVWQVLDDVAEGRSWDFICNARWGGRLPLSAVAEAVKLAEQAWLAGRRPAGGRAFRKRPELAAA